MARRSTKPRVGRPALGAAKRARRVQILVTSEVDEQITAAAERAQQSRSDWGAAALEAAIQAEAGAAQPGPDVPAVTPIERRARRHS